MPKVVTFGEIMLRLSPSGYERLFQSSVLSATFGGGEANVAVSLAHFGFDSIYVTRLPQHAVGDAALKALRSEGVRTDHILRGGKRIGIYFAESGASQRPSSVIYDRAHSAISQMAPDAVDWRSVLDGADWFHVTGITPALGANPAAATSGAVAAARRAGVRVSVDLNYRKKLWTEAQAREVMTPLMRYVDVVIANEEDLQSVLGVNVPETDVTSGVLNVGRYREAAERFDLSVHNFGVQEYMRHTDDTDRVFPHAYSFQDGSMCPGEAPGLGVDIDETLAGTFPYTPRTCRSRASRMARCTVGEP